MSHNLLIKNSFHKIKNGIFISLTSSLNKVIINFENYLFMNIMRQPTHIKGIIGRTILKTSLIDSPIALLTACFKLSPSESISIFLLKII
jgi:hypothetical protein